MPAKTKFNKAPGRASVDHAKIADLEVVKGQTKTPRAFASWLDRAKSLGLQNRQLVWELHVVQGRSKADTARALQVTPSLVWKLYEEAKRELLSRAPKNPEDFEMMREELKDRILSVYEDASKDTEDPRMLVIRLKCVEQLSKLHGLNIETPDQQKEDGAHYATPEELREAVQARMLEVHGRAVDVAEVTAVFAAQREAQRDANAQIATEENDVQENTFYEPIASQ